jgi:HAD-superfamily hydrolase, subfamily IIB
MNNYKMFITDIDGTLLNSDKILSQANKESLIKLQESGTTLVLASGRPTYGINPIAKELQMDRYDGYILSYNGSYIIRCRDNKILESFSLTKEDVHKMYDFAVEHNLDILTYLNGTVISNRRSEYVNTEVVLTKMAHLATNEFKRIIDEPCVKVILLGEPTHLKQVEKILKEKYSILYNIAISEPIFLEVFSKEASKGVSMLKLAQMLNIDSQEIIAIGDSFNDLEMLKLAGTSIAVENSSPEIKGLANHIGKSNDEDAVAHVINNFILDAHM